MHVDVSKLSLVLKKVAHVRARLSEFCLGQLEPALSVMDLRYTIEQVYDLRIEMIEVDFTAVHFQGKVERYADKRARVIVRSSLSDAEKRLVTVKELCHIIIDEKEDWSTFGANTINELLNEDSEVRENGEGVKSPTTALHSELMAMLAAGELMYHLDYRAADAAKLEAEEATLGSIAMQHDVPAYLIAHVFRNSALIERARDLPLPEDD